MSEPRIEKVDKPLFVLDRIENDVAVLEGSWPNGTTTLGNCRRALLPLGAREGDVLTITVTIDEEATAARRQAAKKAVAQLMEERSCGVQEGAGSDV